MGKKSVIEVTVISAEGLRISRSQGVKRSTFVVVRSDPFNHWSTGVDRDGGSYPAWNEKMVMELPVNARFFTVEAHSGSKLVGAANVPVSDFLGGFLPHNYLNFLSYRLRDASGVKNGIVNISVKVKAAATASCSAVPWRGVPVVDGKVADHGIATGIPVSYKY